MTSLCGIWKWIFLIGSILIMNKIQMSVIFFPVPMCEDVTVMILLFLYIINSYGVPMVDPYSQQALW